MNQTDWRIVYRLVKDLFPQVDKNLAGWTDLARSAPCAELKRQALASIEAKRFHCQGGSVYALAASRHGEDVVAAIVALQTISDYLDNLCDRAGVEDETAFRRLHRAMVLAVSPGEPLEGFYEDYPYRDDGGYLRDLVQTCRTRVSRLPSFAVVADAVLDLIGLYNDLQVYKHLAWDRREDKLIGWARSNMVERRLDDVLLWNEFAAASGSTLGIFALMAAATKENLDSRSVDEIVKAYFPWICALHILLDYLIDMQEDRRENDLNFVEYYPDPDLAEQRLGRMVDQAVASCGNMERPAFHRTVVKGLLAMYLSDSKVASQDMRQLARSLLREGGGDSRLMWWICRGLRSRGIL